MRMRNPWGVESYFGDWGDRSDKWTEQYKQEAGYVDDNDGAWFISAEDYHWGF